MPTSFFSGEELADWLNADKSSERRLADLEERIIGRLEDATGRHFGEVETLTEVSRQNGRRHTITVSNPILSLVAVRYGLTRGALASLPLTSLSTDGNRVTYDLAPFPAGFVEIDYQAGYEQDDVPPGLKQDVLDLVARSWRARVTDDGPQDGFGGQGIPDEMVHRYLQPAGV